MVRGILLIHAATVRMPFRHGAVDTLWPAPSSSPHGGRLGIRPYRAVFPGVIFLYDSYRLLSTFLLTHVGLLSILLSTATGNANSPGRRQRVAGSGADGEAYRARQAASGRTHGCSGKAGDGREKATGSFPIWKQPRKHGLMKNLGIHFNRLQFVTNWIFDISAPKTAERGESDNIRTRVRQARDLPVRGASRPAHETEISSQELLTFASSSHR